MPAPIIQSLIFLVQVFFSFYLAVIIFRILFRMVHADYYHPIIQTIIRFTEKPIVLLKRVFPNVGAIELSAVVWLILVGLVKLCLLCLINERLPHPMGVWVWLLGDIIKLIINVLFFTVIAYIAISWLNPQNVALSRLLHQLVGPMLRPARRWIPPLGGFDLSPVAVLIVLQVLSILIAEPLLSFGMGLSLS